MRDQINQGTALARQIAYYTDKGSLAPNELVFAILERHFEIRKDSHEFLFDDFPRNIEQAELLEKKLSSCKMQVDGAILLEVPKEELLQRIKIRAKAAMRIDDQDEAKTNTRMRAGFTQQRTEVTNKATTKTTITRA